MPTTQPKKTKTKVKDQMLPVVPMRDIVFYPFLTTHLYIGRAKSLAALEKAASNNKRLFLVTQKRKTTNDPMEKDLYSLGVIGRIVQTFKTQDSSVKIIIQGLSRAKVINYQSVNDYYAAEVEELKFPTPKLEQIDKVKLYYDLIRKQAPKNIDYSNTQENIDDIANTGGKIEKLCYQIIFQLNLPTYEKQELLETINLADLVEKTYKLMVRDEESRKIESKVRIDIQEQISKNQKDYFLNEQLKAIQKELGVEDQNDDWQEIERKIKEAKLPPEAQEVAQREMKKLRMMPGLTSEANVVRNYIDWIISIPWYKTTQDNLDLKKVKNSLDKGHYGLAEIKDRLLDYLALAKRAGNLKGPILCLVGPPGVGKTSLAQSVAKALGRNFVRISLGGIRDEADIRGHRRTYIGALPGRIINAMKKAKTINPVMLLDEVDKITSSNLGDPSSALLEVLDTEQNSAFFDHYLELDYDLSKVMFICTANLEYDIMPVLKDRMEMIHLTGYSEQEKKHIFLRHLVGKQLEAHHLTRKQVQISENIMVDILRGYTKEAGIRELERSLAKIYRKANRDLYTSKNLKSVKLTKAKLVKYLGPVKFHWHSTIKQDRVGVVNGLAWTSLGGEVFTIEVLLIPGKGKVILTGKLGEIMKESAQAAISYVKANAASFGIAENKFDNYDLHVHALEGAVPKDGPSAGVALCTAIVSIFTNRPVYWDIAMTGEISLQGRILTVGGVIDKLLAAYRSDIKHVFIPKGNEKDLSALNKDQKGDLVHMEVKSFEYLSDLIPNALKPGALPHPLSPSRIMLDKDMIETN